MLGRPHLPSLELPLVPPECACRNQLYTWEEGSGKVPASLPRPHLCLLLPSVPPTGRLGKQPHQSSSWVSFGTPLFPAPCSWETPKQGVEGLTSPALRSPGAPFLVPCPLGTVLQEERSLPMGMSWPGSQSWDLICWPTERDCKNHCADFK